MTRRRLKLSEKTIKQEMDKMGFYGKVRENKIDSWY